MSERRIPKSARISARSDFSVALPPRSLAFPVEHPAVDIESCRAETLASEKKGGRKIHVMAATEINGPEAHPVYRYLKQLFDIEELQPRVAHYFFVDPDMTIIEHHHGASYNTLKSFVMNYDIF